ncbi:MAG: hypothetical protein ACR2QV_04565 [Gammaproteobacteria bacterium]
MLRSAFFLFAVFAMLAPAHAQTMTLSVTSGEFVVTNVFGDVDTFSIEVEINAPLAPGLYVDPEIVRVNYQVTGVLEPGTPSGFASFDLRRDISGTEFYAQGSALSFEIAPNAVLSDGVQVAELVGSAVVLTFNAREIDNGRFHPALLELRGDGTGRIQNSDNVPTLNPLVEVDFGAEYITDLVFDPGNTTLITITPMLTPTRPTSPPASGGSSSAISPLTLGMLLLLGVYQAFRRLRD